MHCWLKTRHLLGGKRVDFEIDMWLFKCFVYGRFHDFDYLVLDKAVTGVVLLHLLMRRPDSEAAATRFPVVSLKGEIAPAQYPAVVVILLLSGFSDLTKRQWSRVHRSLLSFLVPEYWRRLGSSYRKKSCGFRASSWMRRRSVNSTKRWSDGCRNVSCCSPRWVSR